MKMLIYSVWCSADWLTCCHWKEVNTSCLPLNIQVFLLWHESVFVRSMRRYKIKKGSYKNQVATVGNKPLFSAKSRTHQAHTTNCIWIRTKWQNKQAQVSAAPFSICNKPPERQATASCLARREWNRLHTRESTAQSRFLMGCRARRWSGQRGPTCSDCRDRRGRREHGSEEIWRGACEVEKAFCCTCQVHEQSTSVHSLLPRQMSLSENRAS